MAKEMEPSLFMKNSLAKSIHTEDTSTLDPVIVPLGIHCSELTVFWDDI